MSNLVQEKNFHILTFKYALEGILAALKQEPNLKFHLLFAVLVIILSFILKISQNDWVKIVILSGFVISLELTNTAIERVVDEFVDLKHPGAKLAKDISAGAVLVAAITAVIAGLIIFIPYLI